MSSEPLPIAPVSSSERFTRLEVGNQTVCALTEAGRLFCWGSHAVPVSANVPTDVQLGVSTRSVSVGTEGTACALGTDDVGHCWGRNDAYQLGVRPLGSYAQPLPIDTDLRFSALAIGFHDACALTADGKPWCWGDINYLRGSGGNASDVELATPTRIDGAPPLVNVTPVIQQMGCGLTTTGEAWCWGELDGDGPGRWRPATRVVGLPPLRTLVAGVVGACGISADGEAWCWDNGWGIFGPTPVRWAAPHRFRSVAFSFGVGMCGITTTDEVLCTGAVPTP